MRKYNTQIRGLFFISALLFLNACSPKISTNTSKKYPPLDYKQDVLVIGLDQTEPGNAEDLGTVKIGDNGFTLDCTYETVIESAKLEARKVGGNAIKIIEHKMPNALGSSCHRITAKILRIANIDSLIAATEADEEMPADVDYAVLNIYRYGGNGAFISYDLYLGDSVICRVKNNFKTTLHIKKDGLNTLWAKTESKSEIPIDFKMGKNYYLRCGIMMGAFVGRPKLELVDIKTGKSEFESFKAKNQ
ncbi:MAG: hypothetical protein ABI266_08675 [Ginsengibacter sp.]